MGNKVMIFSAPSGAGKSTVVNHLLELYPQFEFSVSAVWHFAGRGIPVRLIFPAGKVTHSTADSYETFMEFYSIAADGIFYYSRQDYEQFLALTADLRSRTNEDDTWILIREDPEPGQDPFTVFE